MTQKAKLVQAATRPGLQVVLFGLDQNGKPKAARFSEPQADLATKAAAQLKLRVLTVSDATIAELAAKLPSGRVHANGKGFIPTIRHDLYSKLLEASGEPPEAQSAPINTNANQPALKLASKRPPGWAEIAAGHIVIIQDDDPKDGWWDAIVVGVAADMLSLRWRANTRGRTLARHRNSVALMYPEPASSPAEGPAPVAKNVQPNHKKGSEAASRPTSIFPRHWSEIRSDHIVLAREDGPLSQWWEATVVSQQNDTFTLRWRDYADLPTITRPRQELALMHARDK